MRGGEMAREEAPHARHPSAEQEVLPLEVTAEPIPFSLTARARRAVAPESLPDLGVVDEDVAPTEEDPHDTRRARARALRRAGTSLVDIAAELEVDELLVRAWVDEVAPVHTARRRLRAVGDVGRDPVLGEEDDTLTIERQRARQNFATARESGRDEVGERVPADAAFASSLGLVAGMAELGQHAIVLRGSEPSVLAPAVRWLRGALEVDPARVRYVVRVAPQAAADVAAHRWAEQLDVEVERITTTRWSGAPDAEATEAMIRISDPAAAGRFAGWRDALLAAITTG